MSDARVLERDVPTLIKGDRVELTIKVQAHVALHPPSDTWDVWLLDEQGRSLGGRLVTAAPSRHEALDEVERLISAGRFVEPTVYEKALKTRRRN